MHSLPIHRTEVVVMQPVADAPAVEQVPAFLYPHYVGFSFALFVLLFLFFRVGELS